MLLRRLVALSGISGPGFERSGLGRAESGRWRGGVRRWSRPGLVLLVLVALTLATGPTVDVAAAESSDADPTGAALEEAFVPVEVKEKDCSADDVKVTAACKWLEKQRKAEERVQAEIGLGFNADETGDEEDAQFKLDADIALSLGRYPRAMRVKSGARLRFEEGELEDEVSTLLFNYDYYFRPYLESWVFTERFSDTFMDIEERYEVGMGVDLERSLFATKARELEKLCPGSKTGLSRVRQMDRIPWLTREAREHLETVADTFSAGDDGDGEDEQREERRKAVCRELAGLLKNHAKLTVSMATSFFAEFEKAEPFTIRQLRGEDRQPVESEFRISPEWQARWGLRPSLHWRISDNLELLTRVHFKLPLSEEWRVDGELDYRIDAQSVLTLVLDEREKLKLVSELDYRYDAVPPRVPVDRVLRLEEQGFTVPEPIAEDTHWVYRLQVKVSMGG